MAPVALNSPKTPTQNAVTEKVESKQETSQQAAEPDERQRTLELNVGISMAEAEKKLIFENLYIIK